MFSSSLFLETEVEKAAVEYKTLFQEAVESMETAVDICPERMDAADAEAPRPPRIETAVGFWSGVKVESL